MKLTPVIAGVSLILPAVAAQTATAPKKQVKEAPIVVEARDAVKRSLKDPFSAVFQNVQARSTVNLRGEPMEVVCGEVNAKNAYGGYIGFARWIFDSKTRSAYVMGGPDDFVAATMIKNFCS